MHDHAHGIVYGFFAGQSCTLNQFFIAFNLTLCTINTVPCVHLAAQEASPRSGMTQASMAALYCTFLFMSAVGNHTHTRRATRAHGHDRPRRPVHIRLHRLLEHKRTGIALARQGDLGAHPMVTTQPPKKDLLWYQARVAAGEAGAIPASALDEVDDSDEVDAVMDEERDDERTGTRYNVRLLLSDIFVYCH